MDSRTGFSQTGPTTLFSYPEDIRKVIYTINAIESLNSVVRKAVRKRKLFPTDDSAMKIIYVTIRKASKNWAMPIQNSNLAMNRFMIEIEDRLADYI
jgi:transposase-like protein